MSVNESSSVNTTILTVVAIDKDAGYNAVIRYIIAAGNDEVISITVFIFSFHLKSLSSSPFSLHLLSSKS